MSDSPISRILYIPWLGPIIGNGVDAIVLRLVRYSPMLQTLLRQLVLDKAEKFKIIKGG